MERNCDKCALKTLQGGTCPIFRSDMTGEQGCPQFVAELEYCEVCGNIVIKGGAYRFEDSDESWHLMCDECANGHPCAACESANYCALQQDQSCPEPLHIMQTMRQGNMVVQQQVINPKRIELTCGKCKCYHQTEEGEFFCFKNEQCACNNYKVNWRK